MEVYILFCVFCVLFTLTGSHYRTYNGCYADDKTNKILPHHRFDSPDYMTNDRCAQICCMFLEGATYSGTENGGECYCGTIENSPSIDPIETDCKTFCSANNSEICGDKNKISISNLTCSEIRCQILSEPPVTIDLDAKIAAITEQIRVDKKQTRSYRRAKESAHDNRKSSQYIGFGAILVIVLPIIIVVLSDIMNLFKCKGKNKTDKNKSVNN